MEVQIVGSTRGIETAQEALKFSQIPARICYSEKDWSELEGEEFNKGLMKHMVSCGHHSVMEHIFFSFYINGLPKALAMVLNNERPYVTSEKSARYTVMDQMKPEQRRLYDKWMKIFREKIPSIYPKDENPTLYRKGGDGKTTVQKLAQENARYMTSVFTPTRMAHTLSLRQLNFLIHEFERFIEEEGNGNDAYKEKLSDSMKQFLDSGVIKELRIEGLRNQTGRRLSFFGEEAEEYFGKDVYSTNSLMSFACLAQAHRHRTIDYRVSNGYQLGAPLGFFVPPILGEELRGEWINDLESIAREDFPQAQLLKVAETGEARDFYSKTRLRLCGHAQLEIMRNTLTTGKRYAEAVPEVAEALKPSCFYEPCTKGGCNWKAERALERLI